MDRSYAMEKRNYSEITPAIRQLTRVLEQNGAIDRDLYELYQVNRGLRDVHGNGVLTGLTEISEVNGRDEDGNPIQGELYYRGYHIRDLVRGFLEEKRYGFEEITYLLLFGALPDQTQLQEFEAVLGSYRSLPNSFVRDIIMKAPSANIMNSMARSVLTLYSYDNNPDDTSLPNVLRQSLQLIATFPSWPCTAIRRMIITGRTAPISLFTTRCPLCPRRKTSSICSARTGAIRPPRRGCWTWRWCSTRSTAAATTPPSPAVWSLPPAPTPTPPSARRCPP